MRNITDTIRDDKTAYELRRGTPFPGLSIPLGALSRYMPDAKKAGGDSVHEKLRKFDPRTRRGIFMGYHVPPGCKWGGDYRVLDYDVCAKAESMSEVKPFRVKEVFAEDK